MTIVSFAMSLSFERLESIAAQTFVDFDLVVLDNASTQDYAPVLERFRSLGLTYIRNPENVGAARNIEKARTIGMRSAYHLSLIHISEPTRRTPISYAVFCL